MWLFYQDRCFAGCSMVCSFAGSKSSDRPRFRSLVAVTAPIAHHPIPMRVGFDDGSRIVARVWGTWGIVYQIPRQVFPCCIPVVILWCGMVQLQRPRNSHDGRCARCSRAYGTEVPR